jgi:hypothetical protein
MGNNVTIPSTNWKFFVGFLIGLFTAFVVLVVVANTVPPPPREP